MRCILLIVLMASAGIAGCIASDEAGGEDTGALDVGGNERECVTVEPSVLPVYAHQGEMVAVPVQLRNCGEGYQTISILLLGPGPWGGDEVPGRFELRNMTEGQLEEHILGPGETMAFEVVYRAPHLPEMCVNTILIAGNDYRYVLRCEDEWFDR